MTSFERNVTCIYLSGPIMNCSDEEAHGWRDYIKDKLAGYPVKFVDPTDRNYDWNNPNTYKMVVNDDKQDILSCDCIIVNYMYPSVGTSMEVLYAYDRCIPVYVITNGIDISPWLQYHATTLVQDINSMINIIEMRTPKPI